MDNCAFGVRILRFIAQKIIFCSGKDCEIMKKAVMTLSFLLEAGDERGVSVTKKVIFCFSAFACLFID